MAVWEASWKKWGLWKEINKAEAICSLCDISYEPDWEVEIQNMWPSIFSSTCQIFNATVQSKETACSVTLGRMDGMVELNRKKKISKTWQWQTCRVYTRYHNPPQELHMQPFTTHNRESMLKLCKAWHFYVLTQDLSMFLCATKAKIRTYLHLC